MSPAPNAVDSILAVDDVVVRFDTPEGPITAVDDVSFKVRQGEFLSVIGPSGCGKSTLFNVIGGLLSHHDGVVSVGGETISGPHHSIGMVFQEESTFPWRTVIDNVAFPLELVGMRRAERTERARYFIGMVGLNGFENRYPGELSGGMRQRVSLARTLASEPKILLMDEPFAALDEQTRLLLGDKVLQIQQQLKQTTLLITHNITEAVHKHAAGKPENREHEAGDQAFSGGEQEPAKHTLLADNAMKASHHFRGWWHYETVDDTDLNQKLTD